MNNFKIGDEILCIEANNVLKVGGKYVVAQLGSHGSIRVLGNDYFFLESRFKLSDCSNIITLEKVSIDCKNQEDATKVFDKLQALGETIDSEIFGFARPMWRYVTYNNVRKEWTVSNNCSQFTYTKIISSADWLFAHSIQTLKDEKTITPLEECKRLYKIGMKIKVLPDTDRNETIRIRNLHFTDYGNDNISLPGHRGFLHHDGKFAEIIMEETKEIIEEKVEERTILQNNNSHLIGQRVIYNGGQETIVIGFSQTCEEQVIILREDTDLSWNITDEHLKTYNVSLEHLNKKAWASNIRNLEFIDSKTVTIENTHLNLNVRKVEEKISLKNDNSHLIGQRVIHKDHKETIIIGFTQSNNNVIILKECFTTGWPLNEDHLKIYNISSEHLGKYAWSVDITSLEFIDSKIIKNIHLDLNVGNVLQKKETLIDNVHSVSLKLSTKKQKFNY